MKVHGVEWTVPPEAVWDVLADVAAYPQWVVGMVAIESADESWPRAGATLDYRFRWGLFMLRGRATVLEAHAPGHLRVRWKRRLLGDAVAEITVAPTARGCRVRLAERPRGLFAGLAADPGAMGVAAGHNVASLDRLRRLASASWRAHERA